VSAILKITLLRWNKPDERIWIINGRGTYAVKNAYIVCAQHLANIKELKIQGEWTQLWLIPPNIFFYMWRFGSNCLPNCANLQVLCVQVSHHLNDSQMSMHVCYCSMKC